MPLLLYKAGNGAGDLSYPRQQGAIGTRCDDEQGDDCGDGDNEVKGATNNGDGALNNSVTDKTADWRTWTLMDGPGRAWTATGLSWKGTVANKTSVAWTALA
ncbi:uncharacterized protein E0L32_010590 [Thyridium curvatum]|uniref:Uncharacterized protein n=1 Tax=Thyridium curvatum TaxID=1093900 RepID=A0A507AN47_9PEZI|nr:uncharacterized protein E0L32_010590 [Thyridium curvatum]TPX07694.1 hypothetical protein E0L32_010590 [Thyridium curvatum]